MKSGFARQFVSFLLCALLPLLLYGCGGGGGGASAETTAPANTVLVKVAGVANPGLVRLTVSGSAAFSDNCRGTGQYSFNQGSGTYTVTPTLAGYSFSPANQTVTVSSSAGAVVQFTGTRFAVAGKVSGANGAGVNGAKVTVTDQGGAVAATATCDANGLYTLSGLQVGAQYLVTPSHPLGGIVFTPANRTITTDGSNQTADFTTDVAAYQLSGTVRTEAGGAAPGVALTLSDPLVPGFSYTTVSDGSGKYAFPGLPERYYKLSPGLSAYSYPGYSWGDAVLVDHDFTGHDIQTAAGGTTINFPL